MPSPSTPRATPRLLLALCFHLLQSVHSTSSSPIAPNDANAFQTAYNDNTITRIVLSAGTWSWSSVTGGGVALPLAWGGSGCCPTGGGCTGGGSDPVFMCIHRTITIEAQTPGSVVFDAEGADGANFGRQVLRVGGSSDNIVTIIGIVFTGGRTGSEGAGVWLKMGTVIMRDCVVRGCLSTAGGAGVYLSVASDDMYTGVSQTDFVSLTMERCDIHSNTVVGGHGGGLKVAGGDGSQSVTIIDSHIHHNNATSYGNVNGMSVMMTADAGGVLIDGGNATFIRTTIEANSAVANIGTIGTANSGGKGGGLLVSPGGGTIEPTALVLRDSIFRNNRAESGACELDVSEVVATEGSDIYNNTFSSCFADPNP